MLTNHHRFVTVVVSDIPITALRHIRVFRREPYSVRSGGIAYIRVKKLKTWLVGSVIW